MSADYESGYKAGVAYCIKVLVDLRQNVPFKDIAALMDAAITVAQDALGGQQKMEEWHDEIFGSGWKAALEEAAEQLDDLAGDIREKAEKSP